MYHSKNWVQQFHLGAMRNNNSRLLKLIGKDAGTDSIGDYKQATTLSSFFDELDKQNKLAKTILYNLNPADNEVFATLAGNFNDGSAARQNTMGFSMVVFRSERWNRKPTECFIKHEFIKPFCRNGYRFTQLFIVQPSRLFQKNFMQSYWR